MKQQTKLNQTGKIPADWEVLAIDDVADVVGGGTPSTKDTNNFGGDIPWITPKDLSNYSFRYIQKGERNITKKGLENSSAKLLPKGAVLLTTRAPVGYVAIAANEVTTNQGFRSLIPKNNFSSEFIYYLLKLNTEYLKSHASGTTFGELSGSTLKSLNFLFPPLNEQCAIASILGSLDNKIALNRSMNSTLEAIGQALFRRWFIDFEFPDGEGKPYRSSGGEMVETELGEVPKGWRVGFFNEIANIKYGFPFKSKLFNIEKKGTPIIRIRDLPDNFTDTYTDEEFDKDFLVKAGDFLVGMDGEFKPYIWQGVPSLLNQRICSITGKKESCSKHFLRLLLKKPLELIESGTVGTTVIHLSKKDFDRLKVIIPSEKTLGEYNLIYNFIHEKIINNSLENLNLSQIRDALLPKLMSGEIRVKG